MVDNYQAVMMAPAPCLIFPMSLYSRCNNYSHFTDERNETHRGSLLKGIADSTTRIQAQAFLTLKPLPVVTTRCIYPNLRMTTVLRNSHPRCRWEAMRGQRNMTLRDK